LLLPVWTKNMKSKVSCSTVHFHASNHPSGSRVSEQAVTSLRLLSVVSQSPKEYPARHSHSRLELNHCMCLFCMQSAMIKKQPFRAPASSLPCEGETTHLSMQCRPSPCYQQVGGGHKLQCLCDGVVVCSCGWFAAQSRACAIGFR